MIDTICASCIHAAGIARKGIRCNATGRIEMRDACDQFQNGQAFATDIYIGVDCKAYCGICQRTVSALDNYCRHCGAILLEVVER